MKDPLAEGCQITEQPDGVQAAYRIPKKKVKDNAGKHRQDRRIQDCRKSRKSCERLNQGGKFSRGSGTHNLSPVSFRIAPMSQEFLTTEASRSISASSGRKGLAPDRGRPRRDLSLSRNQPRYSSRSKSPWT